MEGKGTSAALGGVAILAVLLSPFTQRTAPARSISSSAVAQSRGSGIPNDQKGRNARSLLEDENGPWHALCREFAQTDPHHDHLEKGADGLRGVDEEPVERTRRGRKYDEKLAVHEHPLWSLSSCVPKDTQLRLLIATVPDPEASHLSLDFDRFTEAIQHAAAFHDYTFERYWLPWQPGAGQATVSPSSALANAHSVKQDQPGLLIFRSTKKSPRNERLLVFLVGETPTSGLNKIVFLNALKYIDQLKSFRTKDTKGQVDIAGPTLSASYSPLAEVLRSNKNKLGGLQFNISNPGSTATGPIRAFKEELNRPLENGTEVTPASLRPKQTGPGYLKYTYSSQELRSCQAIHEWQRAMLDMKYRPNELAVIGEDESAFGAAIAYEENRPSSQGGPHITPNDDCPSQPGERLQFPRDLSSLRKASEVQTQAMLPKELQAVNLPQFGVPLTLEDESNERDSPPAFAEVQNAARIDRSLQAMVRRLRQLRTQSVVITATNPLDVIFLLEYLHKSLPDLRLATLGADEFMLGRPKFVDLSGTLVISELPLLSDHAVKEKGLPAQIDSPSSRAQGMFLAVSNLIGKKVEKDSDTYNSPCPSISVVSRNGFRLVYTPGARQVFPCTGPLLPETTSIVPVLLPVPWVWSTALMGLAIVSLCHLVWLAASRRLISLEQVRPPKAYVCLSNSEVCDLKTFFLLILNNQLFLLEWMAVTTTGALFLAPAAYQIRNYQWFLFGLHGGLLVATGLGSAVLLGCLVSKLAEGTASPELESGMAKFNVTVCIIYLVSSMVLWWTVLANHWWGWPFDQATAMRSIQLFEGLSPLAAISVILFAYALWAVTNLHRLTMVEVRSVSLALPSTSSVKRLHDELLQSIKKSFWELPPLLLVAFIISCFLFRASSVLRGIDHLALRTWLLVWGFIALLLTIVVTCHRVWKTWRKLKGILELLDASVLRKAFHHVPKELSMMQIWRIGGSRVSFLLQHKTLDLLERMQAREATKKGVFAWFVAAGNGTTTRVGTTVVNGHNQVLQETRDCLRCIIEKHQRGELPNPREIEKLNEGLNSRMSDAGPFLEPHALPGPELAGDQNGLKLYACYRFVSLIRYSMLQLRNMLTFVVYGYAALLLCITLYPFQGRRTLGSLMTFVFLLLLSGIMVLLIQMNRNPILKSFEPARGGGVGESFALVGKMFTIGGVPLLAVLASQFPSIAEFFVSWIRPAIEATTR